AAPILTGPFPAVERSPELQARLLTFQAVLNPERKPPGEVLEMFHRAQELARSAGATDALLDSQYWEGRSLWQSKPKDAEKVLLAARESALRTGDRYHDALAVNLLGMIEFKAGRYEEAIGWFQKTLDAGQGGGKLQTAAASLNIGMSYARLGVFD